MPASRSLFMASTEFVLGPIVQICPQLCISCRVLLFILLSRRAASYNGGAAVILGGLEGRVELGEPVDPAPEGEVVESGSSHFFGLGSSGRSGGWSGQVSLQVLGVVKLKFPIAGR